ncbi:MAG: dehalogenase [Chloroflexi bacterium]|nr:dehalogenase [Chloroflexota bacterium]
MWWLILGIAIGVIGWWLVAWTRAKKIAVKWYEWLLAVIALGFALLALQNYYAFLREMEPYSAGVMLALLGVPALIFAVIAVGLVWWENTKVAKTPAKNS